MENLGAAFNQTDAQLAREITDEVNAQLPAEKAANEQALIRTGKALQKRGSDYAEGRGQAAASIPPSIYHRWNLMVPGCWKDKTFVDEFLTDNPQCCAPGYKPAKASGLRHSIDMGREVGRKLYRDNKAKLTA